MRVVVVISTGATSRRAGIPLPMHLSIRGFPRVVMLSARQVVLLTQGRLALCAGRCLYLNPSCLIVTVRLHGAATAVCVDKIMGAVPATTQISKSTRHQTPRP